MELKTKFSVWAIAGACFATPIIAMGVSSFQAFKEKTNLQKLCNAEIGAKIEENILPSAGKLSYNRKSGKCEYTSGGDTPDFTWNPTPK